MNQTTYTISHEHFQIIKPNLKFLFRFPDFGLQSKSTGNLSESTEQKPPPAANIPVSKLLSYQNHFPRRITQVNPLKSLHYTLDPYIFLVHH